MLTPTPIDPGHPYGTTKHISFNYYKQQSSPAPFSYEYFLSLPPGYSSSGDKRWPLILFLHGAGESQGGQNDSYLSLRHGVPKVILCYDRLKDGCDPHINIPTSDRRGPRKAAQGDLSSRAVPAEVCEFVAETFVTITPSLDVTHGYGWKPKVLSALLDEVVQIYRVDVDVVHVTGFSMGGYGTWRLGIDTPDRFASLMPICGGGDASLAKNIVDIPQWIHHGEQDNVVPIEQSIEMEQALRKAGAVDVQFTRYPDAAHDSWTFAYENIEVFRWILAKRRKAHGHGVREDNEVAVSRS